MNMHSETEAAKLAARELMKKGGAQIQTWSMCMFIGVTSVLGGIAVGWLIPMRDTTPAEQQGWGTWIVAAAAVVIVTGLVSLSGSKQKIARAYEIGNKFGFDPSELRD